jgi:hypothetical protein
MNPPETAKVGRAWGQRLWATRHQPATRWLATGVAFMGITSFFLYVAVDVGGLSVAIGSLVAAESLLDQARPIPYRERRSHRGLVGRDKPPRPGWVEPPPRFDPRGGIFDRHQHGGQFSVDLEEAA